ncbi:MAG: glycoside hydrolase family 15 protein [Bacteroidetes bacterium]|nr:glycoside hydrolase family 15 protein [Bacteroidota bacterium]MBS1630376.1 glycoside hydrolase family 15 protein [Bacteroidota bacterium]
MDQEHAYELIEDYGIIGDLHTVALVSKKGSIDFMCYPRFDSPSIFGALLDRNKGGHFAIHPKLNDCDHKQMYLPDTAVLLTRFLANDGIAEITDFMPVNKDEEHCAVIRRVRTIRGHIHYEMSCCPRFDYGRAGHELTRVRSGVLFQSQDAAGTRMRLLSNTPIAIHNQDAFAGFSLRERETAWFILETDANQVQHDEDLKAYIRQANRSTIRFWQSWVEQSHYRGRWMGMVNRSAITLKLLSSQRFGSVVAAATFGLPETIGGERNWDYRYTWIRDASFTMYIFLKLGFMKEAEAFLTWIQRQSEQGPLQLMYAVDGQSKLDEKTLDHWEGYKGSRPIRIGNLAHKQLQLDVYGDLLDTIYLYSRYNGPISFEFWKTISAQVAVVIRDWQKPDHGIWEVRNSKKQFLYSRLMCWVALDRGIRIAEHFSYPYPAEQWRTVRDKIFHSIYDDFWNPELQAFVQYKGTTALDASALMMPLRRFISPRDRKWKSTLKAIDEKLRTDVLIYRYDNRLNDVDGLEGQEGTFSMCSFWFVECLAKSGEVNRARVYFEKMLGYTNHLGLYAEEIGPRGAQLGNYPQAFTHLGLISAALSLDEAIESRTKKEPLRNDHFS